jgi:hypothetical protein
MFLKKNKKNWSPQLKSSLRPSPLHNGLDHSTHRLFSLFWGDSPSGSMPSCTLHSVTSLQIRHCFPRGAQLKRLLTLNGSPWITCPSSTWAKWFCIAHLLWVKHQFLALFDKHGYWTDSVWHYLLYFFHFFIFFNNNSHQNILTFFHFLYHINNFLLLFK